ncbi:hypothetical protein ACUHGC_11470 [Testudinibacter sp. P27/CKL/0425]
MLNINVLKRPIGKTTLDGWATMADDIAKVAILAIPIILYENNPLPIKAGISVFLITSVYTFLFVGKAIKNSLNKMEEK